MKMKNIACLLAALTLAVGSMPAAEAKIGSISTAKPASYAPRTSYAPSAAAVPVQSGSARLGGGTSVGMSRSEVVAQARQPGTGQARSYGNVGATAPAPANNYMSNRTPNTGYAPTGGYAQPAARQGYSGATVAGAAIAGAAVGALATAAVHNNQPTIVNGGGYGPGYAQGGGYAPGAVQGGGGYAAPVVIAPAASSSSGIGTFLLILLLLGIGYAMFRLFQSQNANSAPVASGFSGNSEPTPSHREQFADDQEAEDMGHARTLLANATSLFSQLQDCNNRCDKAGLARLTTPELYTALSSDFDSRPEPSHTRVVSMNVVGNQVMSFTRNVDGFVGSIHFRGEINEGAGQPNDSLNEVWHFTKDLNGGPWKLAGIEQV